VVAGDPDEVRAPRLDQISALAAGESLAFPDDASAAAGMVYLSDPIKLQRPLTG
jgi:hypothetical protein